MPWNFSDSLKYKKGLTVPQQKKWVKIANHILRTCTKDKGSNCDAMAIKIANSKCTETKRMA